MILIRRKKLKISSKDLILSDIKSESNRLIIEFSHFHGVPIRRLNIDVKPSQENSLVTSNSRPAVVAFLLLRNTNRIRALWIKMRKKPSDDVPIRRVHGVWRRWLRFVHLTLSCQRLSRHFSSSPLRGKVRRMSSRTRFQESRTSMTNIDWICLQDFLIDGSWLILMLCSCAEKSFLSTGSRAMRWVSFENKLQFTIKFKEKSIH